jgi:mono/diheme cytochrome c family protein
MNTIGQFFRRYGHLFTTALCAALVAAPLWVSAEERHEREEQEQRYKEDRKRAPLSPLYRQECGSCHVPFPPSLLSAEDWRKVMGDLADHYGDDASLPPQTAQELTDFLVQHAGDTRRTRGAGDPPRITQTRWFQKEHDEVPVAAWSDPRVKSAANCGACHQRAEEGSYREREIDIPGYGPYKD